MSSKPHAHKGASLVEIIQNCIVYNDGAFDGWTDKKVVSDNSITVEHGKPLIFGADENKGIAMAEDGFGIRVVTIGKTASPRTCACPRRAEQGLAMMLADMKQPEFPVALGVLYNNPTKAYDEAVHEQLAEVEKTPAGTVGKMLRKGRTARRCPEGIRPTSSPPLPADIHKPGGRSCRAF